MLLFLLPSESEAEVNSRHSLFPLLSLLAFWRNHLSSLSAAASWRILQRYMQYFPLTRVWFLCGAFPLLCCCCDSTESVSQMGWLSERQKSRNPAAPSLNATLPAALWISVPCCSCVPSAVFSILHLFNFLCSSAYSWQTNHCLSNAPQNICLWRMSLAGFSVSHHLLVTIICINVWFTLLSSKNYYFIQGKEVKR